MSSAVYPKKIQSGSFQFDLRGGGCYLLHAHSQLYTWDEIVKLNSTLTKEIAKHEDSKYQTVAADGCHPCGIDGDDSSE